MFVMFFFVYMIFLYKFESLTIIGKLSPTYAILYLYCFLSFVLIAAKYSIGSMHSPNRWSKIRPYKWPTIDIIIPAFNEGRVIYDTVKSITAAKYPSDRMTITIVNDGSTDDTQKYINRAVSEFGKDKIRVIRFRKNRGKKEAMGEAIKRSNNEYIVFVDSDSVIDKQCLKEIIRPFYKKNSNIGAVCGLAMPMNGDENTLTKMQEVRYFNSFRATKGFESLFGFVICCPGCCSAYRRDVMNIILNPWLKQTFLGNKCTAGDDRSLTNFVLKEGYKTVFNQNAVAYTVVPNKLHKFSRQQLRWKKSWVRESYVVQSIAWQRSPLISLLMVMETLLPLLSPFVILILIYNGLVYDTSYAFRYIFWISIFGISIGLYFKIQNLEKRKWLKATIYSFVVNILLFWQLPYAIIRLRDNSWGTR